ncbi:hypothetical protein PGC35_14205 [Psychrobacillus sp. PGGUH221]|uniref:hypothetical protein n=1 Tax=Psychrobacillus sp. PGGUH221 TaxID=3020058 RepID=UPI0035C6BFBA
MYLYVSNFVEKHQKHDYDCYNLSNFFQYINKNQLMGIIQMERSNTVYFKSQEYMPPQCPPSNATSNDVEPVYRFIEDDSVQELDFLNHIERGKSYPPTKTCEALALSFYTTIDAAKNASKKFKNLRNKKIVAGRVTSECGIHNINNYHLNLWVYKEINMLNVFLGEVSGIGNK